MQMTVGVWSVALLMAVTTVCGAEAWSAYHPGGAPKDRIRFETSGDVLQMNFSTGESAQAWGSIRMPFPGFGKKVRIEVTVRAEDVHDPQGWVQLGFQADGKDGKNIGSYNLQYTSLDKLTEWKRLSYQFVIPAEGDAKWDCAATLIAGFSARCTGGRVLFKDIQYTLLPDNAVVLTDFRPGFGPQGVKNEINVIDSQIIQVKYLPGSISNGNTWFSKRIHRPAPGKTVKIAVMARCREVSDPRAQIQLSIQGNDKDGKNIQAYELKYIPAYELSEDFTNLVYQFTIPAGDVKWDRAIEVVYGFNAISSDGTFEFKDLTVEIID